MDNIKDINELRIRIHIANMNIQVESFGITWEGPSKQKKRSKRDSKEINELFLEQQEELDELIEAKYKNIYAKRSYKWAKNKTHREMFKLIANS